MESNCRTFIEFVQKRKKVIVTKDQEKNKPLISTLLGVHFVAVKGF